MNTLSNLNVLKTETAPPESYSLELTVKLTRISMIDTIMTKASNKLKLLFA